VSGRGSTRAGRPAVMPAGDYDPPPPVRPGHHGLIVEFHGEDDRQRVYQLARLPLPGWHPVLAEAFAGRVGPAGGRRTRASADGVWGTLCRFVRYLHTLPDPPRDPTQLHVEHLDGFLNHSGGSGRPSAVADMRELARLVRVPPLSELIPGPTAEFADQRREATTGTAPGYSPREFARLRSAARRDVTGLRDRIQAGEALLARAHSDPSGLSSSESHAAAVLVDMAETGVVPAPSVAAPRRGPVRRGLARQLFVTLPDLTPLLVLLVALSGRNIETIKELPAVHRLLDDRAVELRVTKRRRGPRHWTETLTWEIGAPGRELHTPGGLYLLIHSLCARSRGHSHTDGLWSVWRDGNRAQVTGAAEHYNPFAERLHGLGTYQRAWATDHHLTADRAELTDGDEVDPTRLVLNFNRLKTTVDVRRTRQLGGHLPSAARSNTPGVLFTNYLRGDPTTLDWAHDIIGEALVDAEHAALDAHHRATRVAGGGPRIAGDPSEPAPSGADTGWSTCRDPNHHPATGTACRSSFLDCFHCANALITAAHLPELLALLDALTARHQQMAESDWWARYGATWAAIRHDVLTEFTPAEVERAATDKPDNGLLNLVEEPWNHP